MRIEQLRETGESRPALAAENYNGETRASMLAKLIADSPEPEYTGTCSETDMHFSLIDTILAIVVLSSFIFAGASSTLAQSPQARAAEVLRNGPAASQWRGGVFNAPGPIVASTPSFPAVHLAPLWSQQSRELERFNENATKLQLIGGSFVLDRLLYDAGRSTRRSPDEQSPRQLPRRPIRRTR